jgi:hypothetical protein
VIDRLFRWLDRACLPLMTLLSALVALLNYYATHNFHTIEKHLVFRERILHGFSPADVMPGYPIPPTFPFVFTTPIGGAMRYTYGPEWVTFAPGWIATASTYVELQGRTAWGDRSTLPFHVTSGDWQESDQWLTAVMTAFGSPTRPVPVGGEGRFDGTMTGAFRRPRVEGRFAGERMRAWDVEWGAAAADLVVENSYVDITGAHITRGASTMDVDGRFSLGFPRKDHGEELNARVRMDGRPVDDLKHAFELDDYQVDLTMAEILRVEDFGTQPFARRDKRGIPKTHLITFGHKKRSPDQSLIDIGVLKAKQPLGPQIDFGNTHDRQVLLARDLQEFSDNLGRDTDILIPDDLNALGVFLGVVMLSCGCVDQDVCV